MRHKSVYLTVLGIIAMLSVALMIGITNSPDAVTPAAPPPPPPPPDEGLHS